MILLLTKRGGDKTFTTVNQSKPSPPVTRILPAATQAWAFISEDSGSRYKPKYSRKEIP
ncbi:MAG: hypothetical protein ACXWT1_10995 [Methylobacter sp.]